MVSALSVFVTLFCLLLTWEFVLSGELYKDCGKQFIRKSRIIGGRISYFGEFPWMVSIVGPNEKRAMAHRCGAAILNRRWIITAAHCIQEGEVEADFIIRIKSYKIYPNKEDKTVEMKVAKLVPHERYGSVHSDSHDIALMKLQNEITFDDYAWPICLPQPSLNVTGKDAMVAGWGRVSEKEKKMSTYPRKLTLPIISNSLCDAWYNEMGYRKGTIQEYELCAGFEDGKKDSCEGDSGGPLFLKLDDRYTMVGIVSHGLGCAQPKLPGIYVRVTSYLDWINKQIAKYGN